MKKFFTFIAAVVLGSTAAFAQEENPFMSITPGYGATLDSRNTTVTITRTEIGSLLAPDAKGVLVQGIAGQGFNQLPMEPDYLPFNEDGVATVQLTDASWALPYFEVYYLQLFVVFADATGTPIYSEDLEDYVMGITAYKTPDTDPAAWALNYPSERNFTQEGLTFKRFYEAGVCKFYFTKKVEFSNVNAIGAIVYSTNGTTDRKLITDYLAEWDDQSGLYAVTVPIQSENYDASDIASINVTLVGVRNGDNELIDVPSIMVVNNSYAARKSAEKSGVTSGLLTNNELVNVYNVHGMLVKENVSSNSVNELPAGMYIVNGKKVLVR